MISDSRKNRVACIMVLLMITLSGCSSSINKHEKRGDEYFQEERYDDALAEYRVALRQDNNNPKLLRKLGRAYLIKGDIEGARKYFSILLESTPDSKETVALDYYQFAVRSLRIKDKPDMARALELILEIEPGYELGDFFYHLGDYYVSLSECQRAINLLTKAIAVSTDSSKIANATYQLAFCFEKTGNYEDGFIYFQQLLSRFSDYHNYHVAVWHLGNCGYHVAEDKFQKGDLNAALRYLAITIRLGEPIVLQDNAWMLRGEIYYRRKQLERALEAFNKVLELNPSRREKIVVDAQQRINELRFGS